MTLQQVRLDDLTWADLMAEIRAAIPAESDGVWTLHAPVDPGITLLELYAAELEERLYWLDQVPDALVRGILDLLGVPPPRPAVPAATVLAFRDGPYEVAAGTALTSPGEEGRIALTTDDDLVVFPVSQLRLVVGGRDRSGELQRGAGAGAGGAAFGAAGTALRAGVDVLPADGGYGEAEIVVDLPGDFAAPPGAELALALILETDGDLPASWAPGAVAGVPPPATVRWSYRDGAALTPLPMGEGADGTGGLRRSGVVRLPWPDAWRVPAPGTVSRRILLHTEAATFAAPPRLLGIHANAAVARHRLAIDSDGDPALAAEIADAAAGWLPLPDRVLAFPDAAGRLRDDPEAIRLRLIERDGAEHEWRATGDFSFHGPGDRVFTIDRDLGLVAFGDGLAGRVPVPARHPDGTVVGIRARWELGAGSLGNLGSRLAWETVAAPVRPATNLAPVDGGADPETIAAARARAGEELSRRYRAVTAGDHRTVVMEKERLGVAVARVHVGVGRHPAFPCDVVPGAVTLVIVPEVRRDPIAGMPVVATPRPDPGMLDAVRARLATARLAGSEVYVEGPAYRAVTVAVTLAGGVADSPDVHQRLRAGLARHLDPLVGGDGAGWPFGEPLRPSQLLGVAQDAAGTAATVTAVAVGLDGRSPDEDCDDVAIRPHELVFLAGLVLRVDTEAETGGGLS